MNPILWMTLGISVTSAMPAILTKRAGLREWGKFTNPKSVRVFQLSEGFTRAGGADGVKINTAHPHEHQHSRQPISRNVPNPENPGMIMPVMLIPVIHSRMRHQRADRNQHQYDQHHRRDQQRNANRDKPTFKKTAP